MPVRSISRTSPGRAVFRGSFLAPKGAAILSLGLFLAVTSGPAAVWAQPAAPAETHQHAAPAAATAPAPAAAPATTAPSAAVPSAAVPAEPVPAPAAPTPVEAVPSVPAPESVADARLPHDLSPWGMFMAADLVVKAVMLGLAFASVLTWSVWFAKSLELLFARRAVSRTLKALRGAVTLSDAAAEMPKANSPATATVRAALAEWHASAGLPVDGIKERVAVALSRIEAKAGRRMTAGTGVLATIGATAPFVGLFGTVWGIMNAFIGISKAQTTNLAVVAPGIAEALLATAIGLVAAIPAVVIYNVFARAIAAYKANLADTSAEVMRHLSRDLDRAAAEVETPRLRAAE
ncbi:tonB-system energizer ExbB [Xanthobacter sp. YC-JY1]|uniref:tonB-system energizer ExbB n=1 Tax=Xanthobacter sp. YC-JY1 TaxID=2419844 RepID=UPI001EFFBEAF|nr:tonB-system energizer ExbB [Xanthobacter sp. YC-JY1]UJX45165.1 tonB-system energizer ExbB [Xanthobacter sp. YC-JY1]